IDPAHFALGLALQDQVANPFFGQIATGAISGRTVARSQTLLPLPDYPGISTHANHGSSSTYHSVQITIERRYSRGLSALVSFTGGKLINDSFSSAGSSGEIGEFRVGRFNRRLERAVDQDDVSQRLVVSAVYELPFRPSGFVRHLAGGWQTNAIFTGQAGFPLQVRGSNNFTGINYPDLLRDPTLEQRDALRWFDTDAFRNPADFVIGNAPRTLPSTRGPALFDLAFSAFKDFRIHEATHLEFRAELFNALNHVNLNNPNVTFTPNRQGVNTNPNFGRVLSSLNARSIQLGLRLSF
ncbi:MAG: hypothetical protein ACRD96_22290, partial [Bryobacteraceae bacterium]